MAHVIIFKNILKYHINFVPTVERYIFCPFPFQCESFYKKNAYYSDDMISYIYIYITLLYFVQSIRYNQEVFEFPFPKSLSF